MKIFIQILLTALLLVSFASADLVMNTISISSSPTQHDRDVTIAFNITNTGPANLTSLSWSESSTNIGTWKLPTLTTLNVNETRALTAAIAVPKHASGTITATLVAKSGSTEASLPITIAISSTASLSASKITELKVNQSGTINVSNSGNVLLSNINISATGPTVTFSENNFQLSPGSSKTIDITLSDSSSLKFGINTVVVTAKDLNENVQASVSFEARKSFCRNGEVGKNLSIRDVEISSSGEDDEEWRPLDEIEVEVEVQNVGNDDIDDVVVELGLFDSEGDNLVGDLDFDTRDEEILELGDLRDGRRESVVFRFKVPADIDTGDYKLAVKAFSEDLGESKECTDISGDLDNSIFQDIKIEQEDDEGKFIAFDNIKLTPEEATCGDTVSLRTDVFNIGDEDQDQVKVNLFSRELNLSLSQEIRSDLDVGDKDSLSFLFTVPQGLSDRTYNLELTAEYDYRNGNYREESDESTKVPLRVFGCTPRPSTGTGARLASITATLESAAVAGDEMIVRARITNIGQNTTSFIVDAEGYEDWAELKDISDRLVTLRAGESKEVTFTFDISEETQGEQTFVIRTQSGASIDEREVSVNIEEGEAEPRFRFNFGDNSLVWIIGIINVILIILIIVVAIRIAQQR